MSHVVLALANLMDRDGTLNSETEGRVALACALFLSEGAEQIMFIGWDYRPDSDIAICDAMADHCIARFGIHQNRILRNRHSRDTVGDAILSRIDLQRRGLLSKLTVVTTEYHVPRVETVFARVYGPACDLSVRGSESTSPEARQVSEANSLAAFDRTFAGIATGDLEGFTARLLSTHPFYNGAGFPDRPLPRDAIEPGPAHGSDECLAEKSPAKSNGT